MHERRRRTLATLSAAAPQLAPLLPQDLTRGPAAVLDLSDAAADLALVDPSDPVALGAIIDRRIAAAGARVGIGRWGEDRCIYRRSALFAGDEPRSVHLGLDLFASAGTTVATPLPARVVTVADNAAPGDYGPTAILEHRLADERFHTLWGHLDHELLTRLHAGAELDAGAVVGHLGRPPGNGGWPPHLHLQLILELGEQRGDYPGVATASDAARALAVCPDPSVLVPDLTRC